MKAYSLDLRQKILNTYLEGGISQRQLAKRFCVTLILCNFKFYRKITETI